GCRTASPGAGVADADHEDLRTQRGEVVQLLEVALQLADQVVLDVEDALADLADGVLVRLARQLVADGSLAQPDGVERTRRGERLERSIDRAPRERGRRLLDLLRDLVGCAVASQALDGVPDPLSLPGLAHAWRKPGRV